MNIPSIGTSSFNPLSYLANYGSQAGTGLDADGDQDGSGALDSVQFSPQSKLLAATQQGGQDLWAQLAQALQAGNLGGAQTAFSSLQQRFQAGQSGAVGQVSSASQATTTASNTQTDPLSQDLSALGQALNGGDVKAAQDAFAKLQQDLQQLGSQKHHHHHHHSSQASSSNPVVDISILNVNINTGSGTSASTGSGQSPTTT